MKKWSNRKIAVVGLFISIGIVLVVLGNAFVTIPSFKTALAGVPVKITGFLLGPLAGGVSGIVVDLLSLLYRPTFYFPGYTLDMIMVGVIPGIVFLIQRRMIKKYQNKKDKFNYGKVMLWILITSIIIVIVSATIFIVLIPNDFFHTKSHSKGKTSSQLITNKWIYLVLIDSQIGLSLVVILFLKFYFKKKKFNDILPIITFCFFIEYYLIFSTPLWDQITLGIPYSFGVSFRITFASIKMWFNVSVMYFVWKVINPLIRIEEIEENNVITGEIEEK